MKKTANNKSRRFNDDSHDNMVHNQQIAKQRPCQNRRNNDLDHNKHTGRLNEVIKILQNLQSKCANMYLHLN